MGMKSKLDYTKLCFKFPLFLTNYSDSAWAWCDVLDVDQGGGVAGGARGPCDGWLMGPGCNQHQISPDQQSAATGYTGHIRYVSRG